jgi:thiol-disulfide isomerase/thioredoxin
VPRSSAALRRFSAAPSAYLELNEGQQKLSAVTAAHPKVLAYFTASWCGPCKAIAPHFTKLAQDTAAVKFVKIDVDDNGATAEEVRCSAGLALSTGRHSAALQALNASVFPRRAPHSPLAPSQAGISAVPTFKVFHNDKVTAQFSGAKIDALQAAVKALVEAK